MKTFLAAFSCLALFILLSSCPSLTKRCDHDLGVNCGNDCPGGCPDTCCCSGCDVDTCQVSFCEGCCCVEGVECWNDTCSGKPGFVCQGCCCEEGVECGTDTCAHKPGFKCQGCYCEVGVNCLTDTCNRTFEKYFGGAGTDTGWAIAATNDGGYLLTGSYRNPTSLDYNIYLIKIDSLGNQKFARNSIYGSATDQEYGVDVMELSDKDLLILGNKNKGGTNWQLFLVRTDKDGIKRWEKDFGLTKLDLGFSFIQKTGGSGFLMYGYTETYVAANPSRGIESIIFESTTDGTAGTRSNIGGTNDDYGSCIEVANDGNYLLLTTIGKVPAPGHKLMLYKLDQSLTVLWQKEVITSCIPNQRGCVRRMPGGDGYLIAGAPLGGDMRLVHVDNNGDGGLNSDNYISILDVGVEHSISVIVLKDGNYAAVSDGMTLVKVRHDLTQVMWQKDFEASTSGVHAILEAADGGLVIVGTKYNTANSSADLYVIKTDENGELQTK